MATLKGQNLRILIMEDNDAFKVIAKSTNCTVTLNGNADDVSSKDDVGLASKPEITSKSWSVSLESLDVTDTAAMLNAIKSFKLFTLIWDETSTADNQTMQVAEFNRMGQAYLNDVTFQWDDRTNSTKQLQFTGNGALHKYSSAPTMDIVESDGAYTKGQFVRLFLGNDNTAVPSRVLAFCKSLSLHVSLSLESSTTKDTTDDWEVNEPTAISYDISSNALVRSGEVITSTVQGQELDSIEDIYEASAPVRFQIANTSGPNNRTKGAIICSGSVVITQLTLNGPNRQNADYTAQLSGYGNLVVAA